MAKIPVTGPGSTQLTSPKVTTKTTAVEQMQAVGAGKGLTALGRDVEATAGLLYQKMNQARNYAENAKANNYKADYMAKVRLAESQKRNPDGTPLTGNDISAFQEEVKKGKEGLKNIYTNKDELVKAQMNWDKDSIVMSHDVIKERYKNIAMVSNVEDMKALTSLENSYAMQTTDEGRAAVEAEAKALIDAGVAANTRDVKQAYKMQTDFTKNSRWNRYIHDFGINPTETAKNVSKYGFSIEQAEKARRLNKETGRIVNENRTLNYSRTMDSVLSLQTTDAEIDALVAADEKNPGEGLKEADGLKLKKALGNTIVSEISKRALIQPDTKRYMQALDLITFSDPKDRIKGYRALIDVFEDNHISDKELPFLKKIADAEEAIDPSKIPEGQWDRGLKLFLRGTIKNFNLKGQQKKIKEDIYNKTKAVIDYVAQGKTVDEAIELVAIDRIAEAFPDYKGYPKEGRLKMLKDGRMITVFPDRPARIEN